MEATGSPCVSGENKLEVIMPELSPGKSFKIVYFTGENLANTTIIYINKLSWLSYDSFSHVRNLFKIHLVEYLKKSYFDGEALISIEFYDLLQNIFHYHRYGMFCHYHVGEQFPGLFLVSPEVFRVPWYPVSYRMQKDRDCVFSWSKRTMRHFEHSLFFHLGAQCSFTNWG